MGRGQQGLAGSDAGIGAGRSQVVLPDLRPGGASSWASVGVAALAFLVFLPAVRCGFVNWDDGSYVYENPVVLGGLTAAGVRRAMTDVVLCNWAPLTILSYQMDASLFGTQPWGFHLTNVVIHAVAAGLLCVAFTRMTGRWTASCVAIALWAIHPLRVESVAWVAERKDVLSVAFLAVALVAYERYCRRPGVGKGALVAVAMFASLLSKATLVTLPALLILLDVWPLRRVSIAGVGQSHPPDAASPYAGASLVRAITEKWPLFLMSVAFVGVTLATQQAAMSSGDKTPLLTSRIPNAIHATAWYMKAFFLPLDLCANYSHFDDVFDLGTLVACGLILCGAAAAAFALRRSMPWLAWGGAWFVTSLLPVVGLVQVGTQGHADRYSYIPHIGLAVAFAWSLADVARRWNVSWRRAACVLAALVVPLIVLTERQIGTWTDNDTLWQHCLAVEPDNAMANTKVGAALRDAGRLGEAEQHYLRAWKSSGGASYVAARLVVLFCDLGDFERAREYRDRALSIDPTSDKVRYAVKYMRVGKRHVIGPQAKECIATGLAFARRSQFEPALDAFRAAIEADPDSAEARNNAGLACKELGRKEEALLLLGEAIALNPHNCDYRVNAASLLVAMGQWQQAESECAAALVADPTDVEAIRLWQAITRRPKPSTSPLRLGS